MGDDERLFGKSDEDDTIDTVKEYIWTALRDHTQLCKIRVVDLGHREALLQNVPPVFDGSVRTVFSGKYLTWT